MISEHSPEAGLKGSASETSGPSKVMQRSRIIYLELSLSGELDGMSEKIYGRNASL